MSENIQIAAETLNQFDVVYLNSDGEMAKAVNSGIRLSGITLCKATRILQSQSGAFNKIGDLVYNPAWSWTGGQYVYTSSVAGSLTQSISSGFAQIVGFAVDTNLILLLPESNLLADYWVGDPRFNDTSTDNSTRFKNAIASLAGGRLRVPSGDYIIDENVDCGDIIIVPEPGAIFTINNGCQLTIHHFECGSYQCFDDQNTALNGIKFGSDASRSGVPAVNVAWWGITDNSAEPDPVGASDGTWVDSTAAFQCAFNSAPVVSAASPGRNGIKIVVPPGCYLMGDVSPGLDPTGAGDDAPGSGLYGLGGSMSMTRIRRKNASQAALYLTSAVGADGFEIQNIAWSSAADGNKCAIQVGDSNTSKGWPTLNINKCWGIGGGIFVYMDGAADVTMSSNDIESATSAIKTGPSGVYDFRFYDNWCGTHSTATIDADGMYQADIYGNIIKMRAFSTVNAVQFMKIAPSDGSDCRNISIHHNKFIVDAGTHYVADYGILVDATNEVISNVSVSDNEFYGNVRRPIIFTGAYVAGTSGCVDCKANNNDIYVTDDLISAVTAAIEVFDGLRIDTCGNKVHISLTDDTKALTAPIYNAATYSNINNNNVYLYSLVARTITSGIYVVDSGSVVTGNTLTIDSPEALIVTYGICCAAGVTGAMIFGNKINALNSATFTNKIYFIQNGNYADMSFAAARGANRGNASITLYPNIDCQVQLFSTALTEARTITLSTTSGFEGARFRIVRTAGNTGGPWALSVGGLKDLAQNTWAEVVYSNTSWTLVGYGDL